MAKSSNKDTDFKEWLYNKLKEIRVHAETYGPYIIVILNGDETPEEKHEALLDTLGLLGNDMDRLITLIMEKFQAAQTKEKDVKKTPSTDLNLQFAKIFENHEKQRTVKERQYTEEPRQYTEEERRIREHILAQYDEGGFEFDTESKGTSSATAARARNLGDIERYTNMEDLLKLQRAKREQARLESEAKKRKEKKERERQKKLLAEKQKRKKIKREQRR